MKIYRPGLPPVFTDEDARTPPPPKPEPKGPVKPGESPFLAPDLAIAAARLRAAAAGQVPHDEPPPAAPPAPTPEVETPVPPPTTTNTQIIPPVEPKPLIDNNVVHLTPEQEAALAKIEADKKQLIADMEAVSGLPNPAPEQPVAQDTPAPTKYALLS
jgi:hypothetical protein